MIRDEAFELGQQWASLYPEDSPSRALIQDVMDTSYLVNIVANDFKDGQSIFAPFLLDQTTPTANGGLGEKAVNGDHAVNGVKATVNGVLEQAVNGAKGAVEGLKSGVDANGH
jgi:methylenetetrahydrofolate reductase (NADPH)